MGKKKPATKAKTWVHPFLRETDPDISIFCGIHLAPSRAKVEHLETTLQWKFPAAYQKFVEHYGGASLEAKETVWPRPQLGDIAPAWQTHHGLDVFGWDEEIGAHIDLLMRYRDFAMEHDGEPELMPFMQRVNSADYWCFDRKGTIYFWSHEEPESPQRLKTDFDTLLVEQTRALIADKNKLKALPKTPAKRAKPIAKRAPLAPLFLADPIFTLSPALVKLSGKKVLTRLDALKAVLIYGKENGLIEGDQLTSDALLRPVIGKGRVKFEALPGLLNAHLS